MTCIDLESLQHPHSNGFLVVLRLKIEEKIAFEHKPPLLHGRVKSATLKKIALLVYALRGACIVSQGLVIEVHR